jgi:acyl-coenzyme A synthetase/AMP-(fatty) acid ligase
LQETQFFPGEPPRSSHGFDRRSREHEGHFGGAARNVAAAHAALCGFPTPSSQTAVIDGQTVCSHADLAALVADFARFFDAEGVGPLAAITLANSLELVAAFLALRRNGISVVLLPSKAASDVVARAHETVQPSHYIFGEEQLARLASTVRIDRPASASGAQRSVFCARVSDSPSTRLTEDSRVYKLTSGSSGRPKVVALDTQRLVSEAGNIARTLCLSESDRVMAGVSLLHSYGFDLGVLAPLYAGSAIVIQATLPPRPLERIADLAATVFLGIPRLYEVCLGRRDAPRLASMRYLLSCTGPLAPETIVRFHDLFGVPICQHYGTSETGGLTNHAPARVLDKPASVGKPLDGVSIELVDELGRPQPEQGFVLARSRGIACGYVGSETPTAANDRFGFVDGGFLTRDVGSLDRDGYLYLRPRVNASTKKYDVIGN